MLLFSETAAPEFLHRIAYKDEMILRTAPVFPKKQQNMSDTAPSGMANAPPSHKIPRKLVLTDDDCRRKFRTHIAKEELGQFHKDEAIEGFVPIAKTMVKELFKLGCGKEVALQLSLLILYDMVMLIGLTPSRDPSNQIWLIHLHRRQQLHGIRTRWAAH